MGMFVDSRLTSRYDTGAIGFRLAINIVVDGLLVGKKCRLAADVEADVADGLLIGEMS